MRRGEVDIERLGLRVILRICRWPARSCGVRAGGIDMTKDVIGGIVWIVGVVVVTVVVVLVGAAYSG
jgi:hypothetical protein